MLHFKNVLLPLSVNHVSDEVIAETCELCRRFNSSLCLMTVIPDYYESGAISPVEPLAMPCSFNLHRQWARSRATEVLESIRAQKVPAEIQTRIAVATGDTVLEIVRFAEEEHFDLIVLETHGRSGFARLFMGSTTEHVLRKTALPVLAIHTHPLASEVRPN